ncbi:hypothetical protein CVU82_03270 [Candidatus Falkowbacteria bacterium HGW-Falkowbacteria-1]|jgi:hypothetical protein|uniref:Uncharacterized protein n=1 Tax=Candidatus Falkowbacteria bacterium HGW-Falkowbacteria-1 TaxID=2013768 RepID=A0A2N2E8I3_9BACT|nr:MAG: hypothetical protein CVU82_03270 [Candidatus Falkowbacteria bacterium HGW-Falkowbacteria-1]
MEGKRTKVFTHISVDIDAAASAWFTLRFILGKTEKEVDIIFKPANWDGKEMEKGDYALDINAGGKGIKGNKRRNGKAGSCFMALFKKTYLQNEEKEVLGPLARFIDGHDSDGVEFWRDMDVPEKNKLTFFSFVGLLTVLHGYHTRYNDHEICSRFFDNLDNYLNLEVSFRKERENTEKSIEVFGKVALNRNPKVRINSSLLNKHGFKAVIYVDEFNMGILTRGDDFKADDGFVRQFVLSHGEEIGDGEKWFAHPDGRLFCRGSRKSPVFSPSKINPIELAEAIDSHLAFLEKQKR